MGKCQLPFKPIWNSGCLRWIRLPGMWSTAFAHPNLGYIQQHWKFSTKYALNIIDFFLMCKFSAEFPRMGFRKSWILMELKTCTRRTAYGNMYDTLWFNNTAINSICIIVLLVINIWMWTCTQCIIFWVTSPTSEVACLTWFDDVSASHGSLRVCSYSVFLSF